VVASRRNIGTFLPIEQAKIFDLPQKHYGVVYLSKLFCFDAKEHQGGGAETGCFAYRFATPVSASTKFLLYRKNLVELPGIEPGSSDRETKAATCLVCYFVSPCDLRQTGSRRTSQLLVSPLSR